MRRNPPIRRLGAFAVVAALSPAALADGAPAPSTLPSVDFGRMGSVGFGGAFAGLDWWTAQSQFAAAPSGSNSTHAVYSADGDTLLVRNPDGTTRPLGATNAGGSINAICWTSDSANGTLYIGGSFSSLASTSSQNIIAYSLATSQFTPLGTGLSGSVDTLYCDDANHEVWIGGSFTAPSGGGGNVARWSQQSSSWTAVPFGGLNGRVQSITAGNGGQSLYFAGQFTTQYADNTNTTALRSFLSIPIAPPNTVSVGNSAYLVPVTFPNAVSQYGGLTIHASPGTHQTEYNDDSDLVCPNKGPWMARDNSVATIDILTNAHLTGSGVRMSNNLLQGRSTETFCVTSLPDNTLLKLTYKDPSTGQNATCDWHCPLAAQSDIGAQDFLFADGSRSLTGLHIVLDTWRGAGVGLNYVQLLSDGAYASAVPSDNEGICGASNNSVLTVGQWQNGTAPSNISGTEQGYMQSTIPVDNPPDTSLTLYPWVGSAGYYNIYLVIPGCANLGDCASRTTVDVVVFPRKDGLPYTMTIDQRVQQDTQILLYSGLVDASSVDFNPTIRIALAANPAQIEGDNYIIVASGVQMVLTGLSYGDDQQAPLGSGTGSPGSGTPTGTGGGSAGATAGTGTATGTGGSGGTGTATGTVTGTGGSGAAGTSGGTGTANVPGGSSGTPTPGGSQGPGTSTISGQSGVIVPSTTSSSTSPSATPTAQGIRVAYGVYEWPRSATNLNANSLLPNSTETALTRAGFALSVAKNASASSTFSVASIADVDKTIFVGGVFQGSGFANVVAVDKSSNAVSPLQSQGLNGGVNSVSAVGQDVYFGGSFTSTAAGSTALKYIARYDSNAKQWAAVAGGVDGPVSDIVPINGGLAVAGNFSNVISGNGTSLATGGYAIYNTSTSTWSTSGILFGHASSVAEAKSSSFIGGRIAGYSANSVSGVAALGVNKDGVATMDTLKGVAFTNQGSSQASTQARRSLSSRLSMRVRHTLLGRSHILGRADEPVNVPSLPAVAPASLAGAYWTNSSASGKPRVTILGGNFTQGAGSGLISGVAFQAGDSLSGPVPPVTGVVRALAVTGNELYVGGTNVNVTGVGGGMVKYDLGKGSWEASSVPALAASGSTPVHVNAIRARTKTDTLVVAGNFANAGSYGCPAVCLWDMKQKQWTRPGGDLSAGEVMAVDFGGDAGTGTLVAGGSFTLNGKNVYAARYDFASNSWTPLGTLPGPALSIVVNEKNVSNIYATGYDTAGTKPYLQRWDGSTWTEAANSSSLMSGTAIQNLAFVPLKKAHAAGGSIQNDRMLMASGEVLLQGTGNVSAALYDGAQWHPYMVGSTAAGALGSASSLFWSDSDFSFSLRKFLARGLVVLVAMAIATGLILIIILLILLLQFFFRRYERKHHPADHYHDKDDRSDDMSSTHHLIHDHVQTALHQSLLVPSDHPAALAHQGQHPGMVGMGGQPSSSGHGGMGPAVGAGLLGAGTGTGVAYAAHRAGSVDSNYDRPPVDQAEDYVAAGSYEGSGSDEGRETVMRYDFNGPELQDGELSMRAGQRVIILDDEQSDEWWYARDPSTGKMGVVPATYVL